MKGFSGPLDATLVPTTLSAQWTWWSPLDRLQIGVAAGLLLLALPSLVRVAVRVLVAWRELPALQRRLLLAIWALGIALRVLEPQRLVMVYSAYELTESAAALTSVHRYGAGAQVLQRLLFLVTAPDHRAVVALHTVLGALTLPVLVAWLKRWQPPPWTLVLAAVGLALTPVLVRDAATESNLVPAALALFAGLLLVDHAVKERHRGDAAGAVILLAWAAVTRPELLAVAPIVAGIGLWRLDLTQKQRLRWALALLLPWTLLVAPQAWHVATQAVASSQRGAIALDTWWLGGLPRTLSSFLPLWPHAFPLVATVLALVGLVWPVQGRGLRRALALATLGWTFALVPDLPDVSVPRLAAPIAAVWLLLAAWPAAAWLQQAKSPQKAALALGLAFLTSALPTAWHLYARTAEDDAETVLRRAVEALPAKGACLVALDGSDPPDKGLVQRAWPTYLLRPPHREARLWGMARWQQAGSPVCDAGTWLVIEHRCWARYHTQPHEAGMLPICLELLDNHAWQPVWQARLPGRGVHPYGYYAGTAAFDVGVFRLRETPER